MDLTRDYKVDSFTPQVIIIHICKPSLLLLVLAITFHTCSNGHFLVSLTKYPKCDYLLCRFGDTHYNMGDMLSSKSLVRPVPEEATAYRMATISGSLWKSMYYILVRAEGKHVISVRRNHSFKITSYNFITVIFLHKS